MRNPFKKKRLTFVCKKCQNPCTSYNFNLVDEFIICDYCKHKNIKGDKDIYQEINKANVQKWFQIRWKVIEEKLTVNMQFDILVEFAYLKQIMQMDV